MHIKKNLLLFLLLLFSFSASAVTMDTTIGNPSNFTNTYRSHIVEIHAAVSSDTVVVNNNTVTIKMNISGWTNSFLHFRGGRSQADSFHRAAKMRLYKVDIYKNADGSIASQSSPVLLKQIGYGGSYSKTISNPSPNTYYYTIAYMGSTKVIESAKVRFIKHSDYQVTTGISIKTDLNEWLLDSCPVDFTVLDYDSNNLNSEPQIYQKILRTEVISDGPISTAKYVEAWELMEGRTILQNHQPVMLEPLTRVNTPTGPVFTVSKPEIYSESHWSAGVKYKFAKMNLFKIVYKGFFETYEHSYSFKIDKTPPVIHLPDNNTDYVQPGYVFMPKVSDDSEQYSQGQQALAYNWEFTDIYAPSHFEIIEGGAGILFKEGITTISDLHNFPLKLTVTDRSGKSTSLTKYFQLDFNPPTIELSVKKESEQYRISATIFDVAINGNMGSNINTESIRCRLSKINGVDIGSVNWQNGSELILDNPSDGIYTVIFQASDNAGNYAELIKDINIPNSVPQVSVSQDPIWNQNKYDFKVDIKCTSEIDFVSIYTIEGETEIGLPMQIEESYSSGIYTKTISCSVSRSWFNIGSQIYFIYARTRTKYGEFIEKELFAVPHDVQ